MFPHIVLVHTVCKINNFPTYLLYENLLSCLCAAGTAASRTHDYRLSEGNDRRNRAAPIRVYRLSPYAPSHES